MTSNVHGYPYKPGDTAYVISNELTIRKGTCVSSVGDLYYFLMDDTHQQESYTMNELYPLKSDAQIAIHTKYITPTPSVSQSSTPSPSRTPKASQTTTPTPSPSPVTYPNTFNGVQWTATHGTVTVEIDDSINFTSTGGGSVEFDTSVSVVGGSNYNFNLRYIAQTCQHATIELYSSTGQTLMLFSLNTTTDIINDDMGYSGTLNQQIVVPAGIDTLFVKVKLFADSNYNTPAASGFKYKFGKISLVKYVPYVAPTPTPSSGVRYDATILAKSPSHYWPLNVSNTLNDIVGSDNLTLVGDIGNNIRLVPDSYGNVLSFSAGTPSPKATLATPISLRNNFSLEAWVTLQSPVTFNSIFGTDLYGLQVEYDSSSNTNELFLFGNNDSVKATNASLIVGNTYHIVMTVASDDTAIFYINGVAYNGDTPVTETYDFNKIGSDGSGEQWFGSIGNPAIYDRALTQSEVISNFNAGQTNYRYSGAFVTLTPTPTPSVTPSSSSAGNPIHNFMTRLTRFAAPDPTFVNLGYMNVKSTVQTSDGKIYIGGANAYGSHNYLTRLNSDGTADNTFTDLQLDNNVNAITQTVDGKIYVAGLFTTAAGVSTTNKLIRLNSDGTFDSSYNVNLGSTQFGAGYTSILQASSGKIYIAGTYTTPTTMGIRRLNSDGSFDSAYNVSMGFSTNGPVYLHETADGKIYALGTFTTVAGNNYYGLARLNSDGTVDTTFTNLNSHNNSYLNMTQTADGKIYLVGNLVKDDGSAFIGIRRLNSDGTIDTSAPTSFNDFANNSQRLNTVVQTNDGKIYVGGLASAPGNNNYDYFLRLNSDGSFDNSFTPIGLHAEVDTIYQTSDLKIYIYGDKFAQAPQSMMKILDSTGAVSSSPTINGYYTPTLLDKLTDGTVLACNQYENQSHYGVFDINTDASVVNSFTVNDMDGTVTSFVQDSSGRIYIAGQFNHIAGVVYNGFARLSSAGVLDTTFVDLGIDSTLNVINTVRKMSDNKMFINGNFTQVGLGGSGVPMTYVQRLNSDGTIDNTWTNLNLTSGPFATAYDAIQVSGGKIYLCGSFGYNSGQYTNFMRLNSDGSVDTAFTDLALNGNAVYSAFQTSTGKIYVFGNFTSFGGHAYTNVARLNSDGTVDTSFTNLGLTDSSQTVSKMVELQNGKLMIIGTFDSGSSNAGSLNGYYGLARLNANGTVDTSFNNILQNYNSTNGLVGLSGSTCMVSGALQIL